MKKVILFLSAIVMVTNLAFSQGTSINTTGSAADNSAMLDVSSTTKGVLVPRMTEAQKLAIINPANGLMIYQTNNTTGFWYYNGTSWVQAIGPVGPTGAQGVQGVTGPQGIQGPTGSVGSTGLAGTNGVTGPTGPQGAAGTNGSNGSQGIQGPTGPQGVAGTNGSNGSQGIQGPTGPQGVAGTNGTNGAQGIQGPTGVTGPTGQSGPVGCGNNNYVLKSNGSSAVCTDGPIYEDGSGNVEIGGSSPNAKLQVNGSLSLPTVSVSANYTVTNNDYTIITKGGTAITIYLPNPSTCSGRIIRIDRLYNTPAAVILQVTGGSSTILPPGYSGTPTYTYSLNTTMQAWQSDGTNWVEIQ